jgi:hypothetical protein
LLATVLALGKLVSQTQSNENGNRPDQLLKAAQMCLFNTSYLSRPTITNIQTLFLMVVVKQVRPMSCSEADASWAVIGLLLRLAFGIGLHRCRPAPTESSIDTSTRVNLWLSISMLELRQSFTSAMPSMIRQRDLADITSLHPDAGTTSGNRSESLNPESVELRLRELRSRVVWHVAQVVDDSNPLHVHSSYDEILLLDQQMRQTLRDIGDFSADNSRQNVDVDLVMLRVTLRRALLSLHYPHASKESSVFERPTSYWSSLECSLAILAEQGRLCESATNYLEVRWLSDLLKEDFYTAASTLGYHLLQGAPVEADTNFGMMTDPRETILETLRSCREIWKRESERSSCQGQGYETLRLLVEYIEEGRG